MLPAITIQKSSTKSFFNQIIEQIDLNLLKNPAFTLFAMSNFLACFSSNVVYTFADDLANDSKIIKEQRTYIIMSIGVSNILGRLIIGYLGDRKWVRNCFAMKISIC
jgi:predicted MFS family arabinose efflux permease